MTILLCSILICSYSNLYIQSYCYASTSKAVYLTFDDGPNEVLTPKILAILKRHNVKASFFVVGINIKANPKILQQIHNEGHTIGVHCYRHNYKQLYKNTQAFEKDINMCIAVIKDILPYYKVTYLRFPGGSFNLSEKYKTKVTKMGLKYIDWNCINGDTEILNANKTEILNKVIATSAGRNKAVILMHDNKKITAKTLESVILHFKSKGYVFKTLN